MFDKISEQKLERAIEIARQAHDYSTAYRERVDIKKVQEWYANTTPEMPGNSAPPELTIRDTFTTHDGFTVRLEQSPARSCGWTIRATVHVEAEEFWIRWDSFKGVEFIGEPGETEGLSWADWQDFWAGDCLTPKALER
jgi:hypothetical protein